MRASEQLDWLVQTKLQPPLPRADVIPRPRLLAALRDKLTSHRLTLLSAPAGYGKTTLLAAYCAEVQRSRGAEVMFPPAPPLPRSPAHTAWLTLDEGDNDPFLFLAYLVASLQGLNPAFGITAKSQVQNRKPVVSPSAVLGINSAEPSKIEMRRVVGVLINDVLESLSDPFVLILDDLHFITEPAVYLALDYLLEHLPPQMHLAAGTRHDPPLALARLRARGQLAELHLPDLRFTLDEATAFLNETLRLGLSPGDLAALQSRTEGWPVGLRLLAGSLDRIPTPAGRAAFIAHLVHTDRHVFDFLADEVLSRQSTAVRTFLLQTSILSELTVPLCNAVTGRHDAGVLLEELDRRSLFVTSLSSPQPPIYQSTNLPIYQSTNLPIYRYHALFAEFLRQRLQREMGEQVVELHRRAAQAHKNPVRAIGHYLAAGMWEEAVQAIEQASVQLFQRGLQDTLAGWVRALPPPVREAHPDLLSPLINRALFEGELEEAQSLQERLLQVYEATGDEEAQGLALAALALIALLQADLARAERLIHRALAYPLPPLHLAQLRMVRAWLGLLRSDWTRAEADLEAALAVVRRCGEPLVWLMLALLLKQPFAVLPGGLERIERFCRQATAFVEDPISLLPLAVGELMAFVHLWRGRLEQAIQAGEGALALREQVGSPAFLGVDAATLAAVAHAARGDYAAAGRFFEVLRPQVEAIPLLNQVLKTSLLYLRGRVLWSQGRWEKARRLYARMCAAAGPGEWPAAPVLRLMMRGLLEMAEGRYAEAGRSLREAASLERQVRLSTLYGSARLLLARLYVEWDRPQDALAELRPVLAACEREGTPGLILQEGAVIVPVLRLAVERGVHTPFTAHLLHLLGATTVEATLAVAPVPVPETGESLTPREVEVLRLIATGASNRAIAGQLVISEGTVKSHVHRIFRKLDVASRTEAAARARDLRLA